ncbi:MULTISPECIES: twin-arginine translocase subunit TatC [unclassified Nocardioides]|uniref:twin-arginine translocase subunit TatC n=1 Tax=unclassified Nocardioides TaxID=2615069 RepID=UPI00070396EA|nr:MULTISPECIES: twin-arginine translocase subunit TatC [unclassified Nocardioides]KQP64884.1 preprotein translocase subunit TatC [Nocardioides sp. Leaf285]KQQ43903.1 preprotein translocase subunit TatC [Nocardioides sp. Leaf307]MBJ7529317.1 twin-arginine translocase subunit TatC [Nocardioides sp.]
MSISGVVKLFVGKPVHPIGSDGRMALSDHLRELRARILKVVLALLVTLIISLFFFDPLFAVVNDPYQQAQDALGADRTQATTSGAGGGLLLYLKLCGLATLVLTSPVWLYQIWAFILPGLHPHERKWTRVFAAIAGPLFFAGIVLGYVTLPKGLEVLIGFTPDGLTNLVEFNEYLTFFSRTLLVFGIAFEIPLFVVMLNLAGVVKGKSLAAHRPWIIVGVFLFAAVATPSTDPFTMTFMAVPMVLLFFVSEVIARWNDKRRAARGINAGLSPDEISTL